jgi:hypothetical protein
MDGWQGNLVGDRCNYVLIVGNVKLTRTSVTHGIRFKRGGQRDSVSIQLFL